MRKQYLILRAVNRTTNNFEDRYTEWIPVGAFENKEEAITCMTKYSTKPYETGELMVREIVVLNNNIDPNKICDNLDYFTLRD